MKTRNLAAEATTWALEQSASTAKTEKGIIKAVDKWLTGRDLVSTYLDALQASASAVMSADLKHRAEITAERKSILKIPAYARARFATTAEVKKTYQSKAGTKNIPDYLAVEISALAYNEIFSRPEFSRLQKIYRGENALRARYRGTDNGKWGWDKVVWHYADYSATLAPDGRKIYVDYGMGFREYQLTHFGSCLIGGRKIQKPAEKSEIRLKPHHLYRLYNNVIRGNGIVWRWNLEEKAGEYIHITTGEVYHTPAFARSAKTIFAEAIHAFRLRRDEKKRKQAELKSLENIYVTAADSIAAGNCRVNTEQFNHDLDKKYGVHIIAVSGAALLQMRDDSYTRRAVQYAAQK